MNQVVWLLVFGVLGIEAIVDHQAIYPYGSQLACMVDKLTLDSITGKWYSLYYSNPSQIPYQLELTKVAHNTLCVANRTIHGELLEPTGYNISVAYSKQPGHLEQHYPKTSTTVFVSPWFFLSVNPKHYFTVFLQDAHFASSYAIFTRQTRLPEFLYQKAIEGLRCVNKVDQNGKADIYKLDID